MKASIIHIYLIQNLLNKCEFTDTIKNEDVSKSIYLVRIPQKETHKIIKELVQIGFIERVDKRNIKINKEKFNRYTSYF